VIKKFAPVTISTQPVGPVRRIALIGTYPPRRCGIATFTADLRAALESTGLICDVIAVTEKSQAGLASELPSPPVAGEITQDCVESYIEAARRLNAQGVDLVCVQHEFGIYGGPAGTHVLGLMRELRCPVVTTLHTVLEHPNDEQRRVMQQLLARSAQAVVMSTTGRDILARTYKTPAGKIAIIPHGAPDCPFVNTSAMKKRLRLHGREVILTFGLLSPNKGIEVMIGALPRVVATCKRALYLVIGATHPHLVMQEGEAYRERLLKLADDLGVADNVRFVNAFIDNDELIEYLTAADIYVTPYLNPTQITSGTLAYAVALGKPIVSTPYLHAAEVLQDGAGVLTPFGDAPALGQAVKTLLSDDHAREALARRAYRKGRETIWRVVGERYRHVFDSAAAQRRPPPDDAIIQPAPLRAIERMSDGCGILQHGRFAVPDRNEGYCLDDNARALLLSQRARAVSPRTRSLDRFAYVYAAFVEHAWNPDTGRFRNFMSYDRQWLEAAGSEDSFGRAFWSVGETAHLTRDPDLKLWALHLASRAAPHLEELSALRALAFCVLGLCGLLQAGDVGHVAALRAAAGRLGAAHQNTSRADWTWFEPVLGYDNARLPQALLCAGETLDRPDLVECGLRTLDWLCALHTAPSGCFRPIGSHALGRATPAQFDQQPLEAAAAVEACWTAHRVTGDGRWRDEAHRAFAWFTGANDLGISLVERSGCYDGLTPLGLNLNQGAESLLSYHLATCAMIAGEERFAGSAFKPTASRAAAVPI